jgi:hypothetical protein
VAYRCNWRSAAPLLATKGFALKNRVEKIRLEKTEIKFDDKGNMKKIVTETIEKTTGPD